MKRMVEGARFLRSMRQSWQQIRKKKSNNIVAVGIGGPSSRGMMVIGDGGEGQDLVIDQRVLCDEEGAGEMITVRRHGALGDEGQGPMMTRTGQHGENIRIERGADHVDDSSAGLCFGPV
mmetsp:Transcript_49936/g.74499  ORF Transcript_49936/g.74499 Transcript_49936/m.74499 type:complete len:120 (+) Transcript_49936:514-873(+)